MSRARLRDAWAVLRGRARAIRFSDEGAIHAAVTIEGKCLGGKVMPPFERRHLIEFFRALGRSVERELPVPGVGFVGDPSRLGHPDGPVTREEYPAVKR